MLIAVSKFITCEVYVLARSRIASIKVIVPVVINKIYVIAKVPLTNGCNSPIIFNYILYYEKNLLLRIKFRLIVYM